MSFLPDRRPSKKPFEVFARPGCSCSAAVVEQNGFDGDIHFRACRRRTGCHEQSALATCVCPVLKTCYPFWGSRPQHYVPHAVSFRDIDEVRRTVRSQGLTLVVTRVDNSPRKISRYRPAWDALDSASDFERIAEGRQLRFYRPTEE